MCVVDASPPWRRRVDDGESMREGADVRGRAHDRPFVRNGNATHSVAELREVMRSDLFRHAGDTRAVSLLRHLVLTPGFIYTVTMRVTGHLRTTRSALRLLYPFAKGALIHYERKYGIHMSEKVSVGPGLFINGFGGIRVHSDASIGSNCNLHYGNVLALTNRGVREGCPRIGDRVQLSARAMIVGRVTVGDDAIVGANAVVTKDVPAHGVAVGVPAKIISTAGSSTYVNNLWPCRSFI